MLYRFIHWASSVHGCTTSSPIIVCLFSPYSGVLSLHTFTKPFLRTDTADNWISILNQHDYGLFRRFSSAMFLWNFFITLVLNVCGRSTGNKRSAMWMTHFQKIFIGPMIQFVCFSSDRHVSFILSNFDETIWCWVEKEIDQCAVSDFAIEGHRVSGHRRIQ